jgi:putative salt-induced outer membrane protein YdiY
MHNRSLVWRGAGAVTAVGLLLLGPTMVAGQDAAFSWENATELSFVSTSGNASSSTLGLKSSLTGTGGPNTFKLELGGIRGETSVTARTATGTPGSFTVSETTTSQLTAESYFARGRYDRSLGPVFLFAGVGWDRNTFAGVQNRYALVAGVGRVWTETDNGHFKTDVGATYTIQKDVDPAPGADDAFGGLRASIDAMRQLTEGAQYTSVLVGDLNVEDSEDYRIDWINSLSFQLSQSLAFKTSYQLLFDHQPALLKLPLFDTGGTPTGDVLSPGDKVDSVLTVTLVITL